MLLGWQCWSVGGSVHHFHPEMFANVLKSLHSAHPDGIEHAKRYLVPHLSLNCLHSAQQECSQPH